MFNVRFYRLPAARTVLFSAMRSLLRRLNVYGDFWLRYLFFGARVCPWFMEPIIAWSMGTAFFLALKKARFAVAANLAVIRPGETLWQYVKDTFRVIHNFGWTLTDMAHVRLGHEIIDWEIVGQQHLDPLADSKTGVIILTAHMGNYDVAAPLFARRLKRRIHTVRVPDRHAETQEFMKERRTENTSEWLTVHYNEPGSMLAVELTKLLQAGEFVAIQGDRILFDVSAHPAEFRDGIEWQLPRGPFMLSLVARVPIVPVFIVRLGWRRYRIIAREPFVWTGDPRDKTGAQDAAARWWSACLREIVEQHWYQWFVFERVFERPTNREDDES